MKGVIDALALKRSNVPRLVNGFNYILLYILDKNPTAVTNIGVTGIIQLES